MQYYMNLRLSIKMSSIRKEVVHYEHFAGKRGSNLDLRTICCKKLKIFRKVWCVRMDKDEEGLRHCIHFADSEVILFSILCGNSHKS